MHLCRRLSFGGLGHRVNHTKRTGFCVEIVAGVQGAHRVALGTLGTLRAREWIFFDGVRCLAPLLGSKKDA
jgi:hypothetical protein